MENLTLDQWSMLDAVTAPMKAEGWRWRPASKQWAFRNEPYARSPEDVAARASELLTASGYDHTGDDMAAILPGLLVRLTRVLHNPERVRPLLAPRADG